MKPRFFILLALAFFIGPVQAQLPPPTPQQQEEIRSLIAAYSKARENRDTALLKTLLTEDIDQLVSNGEWRRGKNEAVTGMQRSSAEAPGTRTLTVEKIRLLTTVSAVVDCRYTIQPAGGTPRHMWSTFIVVAGKGGWTIAAIRNMLPAKPD